MFQKQITEFNRKNDQRYFYEGLCHTIYLLNFISRPEMISSKPQITEINAARIRNLQPIYGSVVCHILIVFNCIIEFYFEIYLMAV